MSSPPVVALCGDPLDTRLTQENDCFSIVETLVQRVLEGSPSRQWILLLPWYMVCKGKQHETSTSTGAGMQSLADVVQHMETATRDAGGEMTIRIIADEEAMQLFETHGRSQAVLAEANELMDSCSAVEFQTVPGQHYAAAYGSTENSSAAGHNSFNMAKRRLGIEAGLDVQALLVLGGCDPNSYAEADMACALHCGLATRFVPLSYTDPAKSNRKEQAKGAYGLAQELGMYQQHRTESTGADPNIPWHSDNGSCLTMHQPWASLVVSGIKRVEGRPWPSNFAGVLWIHAAAREPLDSEIEHVEQEYQSIYGEQKFEFPSSYPTSCLLGCVYVPAVMDQSSFREFTSQANLHSVQAESTSEHVFLCERPHRLIAPFSLAGSNKIWNLSKTKSELASLQRGLRAVRGQEPIEFSELLRDFKNS
eukprot:gb/GECG01004855.1/.p1 GENE.gb/GECG01004855.1/~~gb/GECG01004855.1/.p1  ORF type:complete len:422 (+),score=46.57 gb/GECG01004855.1/:1-1266(+)